MTNRRAASAERGLVVGGRGGPEAELLEDGQEEVFAREELERGVVEHHVGEETVPGADTPRKP